MGHGLVTHAWGTAFINIMVEDLVPCTKLSASAGPSRPPAAGREGSGRRRAENVGKHRGGYEIQGHVCLMEIRKLKTLCFSTARGTVCLMNPGVLCANVSSLPGRTSGNPLLLEPLK